MKAKKTYPSVVEQVAWPDGGGVFTSNANPVPEGGGRHPRGGEEARPGRKIGIADMLRKHGYLSIKGKGEGCGRLLEIVLEIIFLKQDGSWKVFLMLQC